VIAVTGASGRSRARSKEGIGRAGSNSYRILPILGVVGINRGNNLSEVVLSLGLLGAVEHARSGGKDKGCKRGDNQNNDGHFYQVEGGLAFGARIRHGESILWRIGYTLFAAANPSWGGSVLGI